jgi:hypothetical protein
MAIFEFTPEDLRSNRNGFISPGQNAWLQSVAAGTRRSARSGVWIAVGFLFFGLCLVLAVIALGLFVTHRQVEKLLDAKLQTVEGVVSFDSEFSPRGGITSYFVDVGEERFSFTEDMSQTFAAGSEYRVYYCKSGPYQFIFLLRKGRGNS